MTVVHTITSGEATFLTNAFVVESDDAVVVVDAMMVRSEARRVRELVAAIGKPLRGLIITHGHPDHYVGAADIVSDSGAPILATAGVAANIARDDDAKAARWQPRFGADWPDVRPQPDRLVQPGESFELGGMTWTAREYGAGESHCDTVWLLGDDTAFIGDLCFNGVHAFMNDGHSGAWLETLARLDSELGHITRAFTGHGEAGGLSAMCRAQAAYLHAYRDTVAELAQGRAQLDDAAKDILREQMVRFLGNDRLAIFVNAGADAIAVELATQSR